MSRPIFDEVVKELPLLTADGFLDETSPGFLEKRSHFLSDERYTREIALLRDHLCQLPKSQRFSDYQRANCCPDNLVPYFTWRVGEAVTPGSIIAAALSLGFTMGKRDTHKVYFNFSAETIETGLAEHRTLEQIKKVSSR
ncbi:MAG: hypothetical protein EOP10_04775 [Proteobacteria bacterium]|nr:MAG: hypothetical protein EOP10_04775 [Pseudomonadota bacterium]